MRRGRAIARIALGGAALLLAHSPRSAQSQVAAQPLGPIEARSQTLFDVVAAVRPLPNGDLLILDTGARRVSMLDSSLRYRETIADTSTIARYQSEIGQMMAWRGDSTLLIAPTAFTMFLIDDHGRRGRSMGLSRVGASACFVMGRAHMPMLDARGRAVCRLPPEKSPGRMLMAADPIPLANIADSAILIRYEFLHATSDSLSYVRTARTEMAFAANEACRWFVMPSINPLPIVDEWTVTADGSLVVARGATFRIEWFDQDGALLHATQARATRSMLTPNEKTLIRDSLQNSLGRARQSAASGHRPTGAPASAEAKCTGRPTTIDVLAADAAESPRGLAFRGVHPPLPFVSAGLLSDSLPFFGIGGVQADLDGNVWVRSFAWRGANTVYRVFAPAGDEIAQVTVPDGGDIVGFGPRHAVYLTVPEGARLRLELARWK